MVESTSRGDHGGSGSEESSGSGSGDGEPDGSSTGHAADCQPFFDEDAGPTVSIDVRNETAEPIYLVISLQSPVTIRGPDGTTVHWTAGAWPLSCETLMQGVQFCGICGCNERTFRITPGGRWSTTWEGLTLERVTLPDGCWDQGACGPDCLVARAPDVGLWTFEVAASTGITCSEGPCECAETLPDGSCVIFDDMVLHDESIRTETAALDYPGATSVELVFE